MKFWGVRMRYSQRVSPRALSLILAAGMTLATLASPSAVSATGTAALPDLNASATAGLSPTAAAAQRRMAILIPKRVAKLKPLAASRGILVADALSGDITVNDRASVALRGASTTKLATAVNALHTLGTAARFPTRIVSGRNVREVVIVAGGDPLLTSSQLRALARTTALALKAAIPAPLPTPTPTPGPTASPSPAPSAPTPVRFTVRVDDTLYPNPTPAQGWPADYLPYVVSPVRPLVYNLRHSSDTSADAARYFASQVQTYVRSFEKARKDLLITTVYAGRLPAPEGNHEIAHFEGNTSGAALAWMMLVSDNDVAEKFFRNSAIAAGLSGSWTDARIHELAVLNGLGVDTQRWVIRDGSGVSRNDRLTARGLVTLLRASLSPDHPELAPLKGYLPVGGVSGTLKSSNGRYSTSPTKCARGKVFAKTGTLHDTVGLAGFARGSDGRLKVFAVMINNWNTKIPVLKVRQAVDQIPATATGCF